MNRLSNRSRSNSPSSSIDSSNRRRSNSRKKSSSKPVKSKEDVQVFTSLPPKVEGDIKCYLKLQITKINWLLNEPANDTSNQTRPNRSSVVRFADKDKNAQINKQKRMDNIIARCIWWGEDNSNGAIFRPRVLGSSTQDNKKLQTTAKYMVRSGPKQFNAYLNDMKTLDIELIDSTNSELIGKVQMFEIAHLNPNNPVKGFFPVFDSSQAKIAEIYISVQFESIQDSLESKKMSDQSDQSRPVTPTSMANLNEFQTKYQLFEKKQLEAHKKQTDAENTKTMLFRNNHDKNQTLFNSNSYTNTLDADLMHTNEKNPILSNLIERGLKLKEEMNKSSNTTLSKHTNDHQSTNPSLFSFLNNKSDFYLNDELIDESNYNYNNQQDLNDVSRLSDPMHDPDILSAFIYDQTNDFHSSTGFKFYNQTDEDQELKNLLEPTNLFSRLLTKDILKPNNNKIAQEPSFKPIRSSDDEDDNKNHVSFELQSSDGEGSVCNEKCVDTLSPQRISLLNLIQIAKLKIDKLELFSSASVTGLVDRLNKIELDQLQLQQQHNSYQQSTKSTNSKSKPPLATKRLDFGQLFFIEYQFPVIVNSHDPFSVMRAVSKQMKSEELISFEHNADYSVLFNSQLLESWWRSFISFKIYFRSPAASSPAGPYLIGSSRLLLRNVLKSRNFKLYKKLAVNDHQNDKKRIGTLHVSIELSSDLKEFAVNLGKLKNFEEKRKSKLRPYLPNLNTKINRGLEISKCAPKVVDSQARFIEEFSLPIQMYLSINEGRGFNTSLNDLSSIYLICRLFWSKEKVKFEANNRIDGESNFCWTLSLSFMIKPSIIENMRNNYMIIEAWKKSTNLNKTDSLIGTIKLPLHEFYLKTNDLTNLKEYLKDSNRNPLIGVDGWISASDPFTGQKVGEINVLLSLGSSEQILSLQKILFDKIRLKNELKKSPKKLTSKNSDQIEHLFTFKIDNIKIHPIRSNNMALDETDYFVKYLFPSTSNDQDEDKSVKFNSYLISKFSNKVEHRILLSKEAVVQNELLKMYKNQENSLVQFEIWSRSSYPNVRERLIGRGDLSIENIISIVNNKELSLNINNRSFVVPLRVVQDEEDRFSFKSDKFIGQLFLTIEYKTENVSNYDLHAGKSLVVVDKDQNSNCVCMNIGILRADGLKTAIAGLISKNESSLFCLENSNIYVKFSLNFINRPQDFKQTRLISSSLSGYTPEFFDYFDLDCPLISKYNSSTKRTICLAEQLEMGQIMFQVWSKFIDVYNKDSSDVLLGTCTVPLEPLLENRIGIRGWIPIKSVETQEHNSGSIEIAVRFTRTDDYLKIIQTGKDLGWTRACDLEMEKQSSLIVVPNKNSSNHSDLVPETFNFRQETSSEIKNEKRKTIKFLIEIEKASNLPKVYDEKLNRHTEPNAFVSFSTNLENPSETVQTKICEKRGSPAWNFQLLFQIDSEYFLEDGKFFVLKVWHKYSLGEESDPENRTSNKILGYVSVDLQPLICGLSHLSGWYNIQDSVGNCQGQIKINLMPQENLFPIKEMHSRRKKTKSSCFSSASQNSFGSIQNFQNQMQTASSCSNLSNKSDEANLKEMKDILKDKNELKNGLIEKLSELDQMNRMLKERLEKKSIFKKTPEVETKNEELIQSKDDKSKNDKLEILIEVEDLEKKNPMHKIENGVNKIADSFWACSLASESNSEKSFNGGDLEAIKSIESDIVEHLPPVCPIIENPGEKHNEDNVKECQSEILNDDFNPNDTDLDQTYNLNASYELIPNRTSQNGSPEIVETYDFVDKIIDCSKLENDEELGVEEVNQGNIDNTSLFMNDDDDFSENEDLTVIVPEELNKIETHDPDPELKIVKKDEEKKNLSEIDKDVNEKFKNMSSKMPNYFLPQEDLEKSMKRLHYNYVNINSNESLKESGESESDEPEQNVKIKLKSTTLLIQNQKVLKQDLSRINKIFHTKFN